MTRMNHNLTMQQSILADHAMQFIKAARGLEGDVMLLEDLGGRADLFHEPIREIIDRAKTILDLSCRLDDAADTRRIIHGQADCDDPSCGLCRPVPPEVEEEPESPDPDSSHQGLTDPVEHKTLWCCPNPDCVDNQPWRWPYNTVQRDCMYCTGPNKEPVPFVPVTGE